MRAIGFYWTKMNGVWVVSGWDGEVWRVIGQYHPAFDTDFEEINENQIPRLIVTTTTNDRANLPSTGDHGSDH